MFVRPWWLRRALLVSCCLDAYIVLQVDIATFVELARNNNHQI